MTKDVRISICGIQNGPDNDGEPIEMIVTGEYYYKNEKHYILYEEHVEGEITTIKNRIKMAPGFLELTKSGVVNVHMIFEDNKKTHTHYHTPYGVLEMGIDAKKVEINVTEDEIRAVAEYALEMNEEFVSDCNIKIVVKPREKIL